MRVLKYNDILNEANEDEINNLNFIDNILDIFSESIGTDDKSTLNKSISTYISDDESIAIKGLTNDSDIYDFFIKYTNDIDKVLKEINHYDKTPNDLNALGLYDYIIVSTKLAIKEELINYLKK